MYKFIIIVAASLPLLALSEPTVKGGHPTSGSAGGIPLQSQHGAPTFDSSASGGFGGYQTSQLTTQRYRGFGQSSYHPGNHGYSGFSEHGSKSGEGGLSAVGGGSLNGGGGIYGINHGGAGSVSGFGQGGSIGHSVENGGGASSPYGVSSFVSSSGHLGSTNFYGLQGFASNLGNMQSLVYGDPHFGNSYPVFGDLGYGSSLPLNSATDFTALVQFGEFPSQFSSEKVHVFPSQYSLPVSTPSTKYGAPTTGISSSTYGVPFGMPSTTYDAAAFGISSMYDVPSGGLSIKSLGSSSGQQYGASIFGSTSTLGENFGTPSFKYGVPSVDLTTSGGLSSPYSAPSRTHGTIFGGSSSTYDTPIGKPSLTSFNGLSNAYDTPSTGASAAYHGKSNSLVSSSPSTAYGVPSNIYRTPSSGPSNKYGVSSKELSAHFTAPLSAPSRSYGSPSISSTGSSKSYDVPSAPFSIPSTSYGAPFVPSRDALTSYGVKQSKGPSSSFTGPATQYGVSSSSHY